ncbi:hypothetical protein HPB52_015670 [Rhipicephalus sanguineus]|uniref:Uncharacterized protein n=1 Tax=Rhipicephalus sanguineus TaxID=34632 RepID=A0A9D4PXU0_RHISA|nr:hypothetical protein HPB52_015670 [Rhipicephalus sanguineus]
MLKTAHPEPPSPARGFLVLGIRIWPANMTPFLAAIDNAFKSFIVDGLIPVTHIDEDEFIAGYRECWISGGAPYRLAPNSNNTNVLGMLCDINKMFGNLELGLAVFDLECEDWKRRCPAPTAGIYSTYRFRNVSLQAQMLAKSGVASVCP